ncbi:hypothetical protein PSEUBRA_006336 [Kalmanozyma brasiliensis GHG001]|uniref:uncharacterized protein n=1 Tax=Kalmanozyma brasiliensis (strain GHG001) TaxID=1365824 RepID=UPI002868257D|nr:uncharacterized protein PSEUBRA_006336 [Kalmanozyma brasiliensis GHG001]KAF6767660.1 hypothetical protein PSEUBRA_006336 [Kalmanozyma brasiliensis GHG001]
MQASWSLSSRSDDESVLTYDLPATPISSTRPSHSYAPLRPARHPYTPEAYHASSPLKHERELSFEPNFLESFPMPRPRKGAMRPTGAMLPHSFDRAHEDDALEAAWSDGSGIDEVPHVEHSDRLTDLARLLERNPAVVVEDHFEVDALKRQVEQLQMALQLQGHQLAAAESRQLRARRSTGQMQREAVDLPPLPAVPERGASGSMRIVKRPSRSSLRPAGASSSMLAFQQPAMGELASNASFYRPAARHPFTERRQSDISLVSTPSLSTSTIGEDKKIDDLNRKVQALEQMFATMSAQSPAAAQTASTVNLTSSRTIDSTASSTSHRSAFRYNTTPSARSITESTAGDQPASKVNKLAAVFKSRTAPVVTHETGKMSFGRKKTDKDAAPKVKVRQGPGRGRMVIKDPVAS